MNTMPGDKSLKAGRACTARLLTLGPAKYEEEAIYAVNPRIPNVYRSAGVRSTEQSVSIVYMKMPGDKSLKAGRAYTVQSAGIVLKLRPESNLL